MKNENLQKHLQNNLRASQLKQVEMLCVIDRICKKNNLRYWLDSGTLLGAVRHKGFIPWDDDLDVVMPLADLERFLEVAPSELPEELFIQKTGMDSSSIQSIVKLRDKNSLFIEPGDDLSLDCRRGIYIDIFGFIPYPSLPRPLVKCITKNISKSYSILHTKHYYSFRSCMALIWFLIEYGILRMVWGVLLFFGSKKKYISNLVRDNGYGVMHRIDSIYPLSEIEFEGKTFNAPVDTHNYLVNLYDDYMTLPSEDKRVVHAVCIIPCLNTTND